ncbi:MAG: DUF3298 domain-containing protein [Patescibacteria group bacterium]|nr:DUF3298 domain-containing protein [Patescibacteria group bacterium]
MISKPATVLIAALFAVAGALGGFLASRHLWGAAVAPEDMPAGASVTPLDIVSMKEDASTSPSVSVEYPQFPSLPRALNDAIASATLSRLASFRTASAETEIAREATGGPSAALSPSDYSFIASWQPAQIGGRYVSFIERYDSYTGGANENQEVQTFAYDASAKRSLSLGDLFPGVPDYLAQISALSRQQLTGSLDQASAGYAPVSMIEAGTAPDPANFRYFTFTDDVVTIYFPKYAVAPGSFGEQHVTISRSSIK